MDQAELRRQLRAQLDDAQRDLSTLASHRKKMQYQWAQDEENLKTRITEINRQLSQLRRAITFPEMFHKVAEARLGPDAYSALMAETAQRLEQLDRETQVESDRD